MVLALVDVPPLLTRFAMKFKGSTIMGGTPPPFATATFACLGLLCKVSTLAIPVNKFFSILVPDLDSAKKREDKQNTEKHPENTEYTQKITKNMGNTIAILKLMDISFLDLFGFLKSRIVLALVDVPPVTHTFCNEIQCLYYQGWHRLLVLVHVQFWGCDFLGQLFGFLAGGFYHDIFLDMWRVY